MAVTTAVILAAGMGTRLQDKHNESPKGFITLGEKPIIVESIEKLQAVGISRIIILTGYLREQYEGLARSYPELIETIHNPKYAKSGSMYTLASAKAALNEDFLLLESDLIYERRALEIALAHPADSVVICSGRTDSGDEVYVAAENGALIEMSKNRSHLSAPILGELVGISKVSAHLYRSILAEAEKLFEPSLLVDYETDAFVATARHQRIECICVEDLIWSEIDDAAHLLRAQERIYPAILKRDL